MDADQVRRLNSDDVASEVSPKNVLPGDVLSEALSQALRASRVVAVVTIDGLRTAVPLAQTLAAAGLGAIEITLRTAAGIAAIEAIARAELELLVGVGTVLRPKTSNVPPLLVPSSPSLQDRPLNY